MNLSQLLTQMRTAPELNERITAWKIAPPSEGALTDFPPSVDSRLINVLRSGGIQRLFTHQALAIEAAQRGENFVVVTPTASGKTLCYNIPVLDSLLEYPHSRAIYLFPTKALSQDQLDELHGLITALDVDSRPTPMMGIPPSTPERPSVPQDIS